MTLYYEGDGITLWHGDCRDHTAWLTADVLLTDPPYGIGYHTGRPRVSLARSIRGDADTSARDDALQLWGDRPALVFGSWRRPRPPATRALLVWDTGGALGCGDLSIPWKPAHEEIYVLGTGFTGRRSTDVLRFPPVQSLARNGRTHPHEKPVPLLHDLIGKCPPGMVADPFAGSGSTLLAARNLGRRAVGVEIDERYCEVTATRLAQGDLFAGEGAS
jgi:DNA modification methylase